MFDLWGKDKTQSLGSLLDTSAKPSPSDGGVPGSALNVEASASAATVKARRGAGKKNTESGKPAFSFEDTSAANAAVAKEQEALLAQVFDPRMWKKVVAAPGDLAFTVTGREHWRISEEEADTLATTGAATFRAFALVDPKWVALMLFSTSLLTIYGGRIVVDAKAKADEKKKAKAQLPATGAPQA